MPQQKRFTGKRKPFCRGIDESINIVDTEKLKIENSELKTLILRVYDWSKNRVREFLW